MIRREFFTALSSLPFLGFLKPESFTMDLGNEVNTKRNTFRDLYAFLKKYDGCLHYSKKNDCFIIQKFYHEDKPFSCSFKGAEKDERSDGENYTRPALIALTHAMNIERGGKATKVI